MTIRKHALYEMYNYFVTDLHKHREYITYTKLYLICLIVIVQYVYAECMGA